jgi:DNA polymerase-3 subunit gamma/tau
VRIWSGSTSLDVVEIDAASNRGVDDARELRERAMYAPSSDTGYKVYIVDEAHMLTREAWNALLKVLEEPPPRVVFVFATTEPQKIAQAAAPVLSRLQKFDLRRIGPGEIRERLAVVLTEEAVTFEPDALAMIARAADGGLRDALSLTDQVLSLGDENSVTVERVRAALGLIAEDEYLALLDLVAEHRAGDVFAVVQRLADAGADFALVLGGFGDLLRSQLAIELGSDVADASESLKQALVARRGRLQSADLLRMLQALLELEPLFRRSGQQQLLLESFLVRCALMDRTIALEAVLSELAEQGATPSAPRAPARRASHDSRSAGASAMPTAPPPVVVIAPPPAPRTATQQVVEAASRAAVAPSNAAPRADAPVPSLDVVRERWAEVAEMVRLNGRGLVAQALQRVQPIDIDPKGIVTLRAAADEDTWANALEGARRDVQAALSGSVPGVRGFVVRSAPTTTTGEALPPPASRITTDDVKRERIETLSARDPLLAAAVRALDLELRDG